MKKVKGVMRRVRREGELASPLKAVRSHCLMCCGYDRGEVRKCEARDCWLWPYRKGTRPKGEEEVWL